MVPETREFVTKDGRRGILRSWRVDDAEAFVSFRRRTCGQSPFLARWPEEIDLTPEGMRVNIADMLETARSAQLVAEVDGRYLGTATLGPVHAGKKYVHRAQVAVAVEQEAWGLGLGEALMRRCLELAPELGYRQVELGVYAENERALGLYRKLGFREIGNIPRAFIHPDGTFHDELQMCLFLDGGGRQAQAVACHDSTERGGCHMGIRTTQPEELDEVMDIYARARQFMAEHGNPRQWGPTNWPPRELVEADIAAGKSHVAVTDDGRIAAVFFYDYGQDIDPCYAVIENGSWLSDAPYGVVHRIASAGIARGAGTACLEWALAQCGHLRIDTHEDNVVLQGLLAKLGFSRRGVIYVHEDNDPRLAYEKLA